MWEAIPGSHNPLCILISFQFLRRRLSQSHTWGNKKAHTRTHNSATVCTKLSCVSASITAGTMTWVIGPTSKQPASLLNFPTTVRSILSPNRNNFSWSWEGNQYRNHSILPGMLTAQTWLEACACPCDGLFWATAVHLEAMWAAKSSQRSSWKIWEGGSGNPVGADMHANFWKSVKFLGSIWRNPTATTRLLAAMFTLHLWHQEGVDYLQAMMKTIARNIRNKDMHRWWTPDILCWSCALQVSFAFIRAECGNSLSFDLGAQGPYMHFLWFSGFSWFSRVSILRGQTNSGSLRLQPSRRRILRRQRASNPHVGDWLHILNHKRLSGK